MSEIRILTVRQPWAWAIIHGGKDVENRARNIAGGYRGSIAIHAGLRFDESAEDGSPVLSAALNAHLDDTDPDCETLPHQWPWRSEFGAIIGVVDLIGVHKGTVTDGGRLVEVMSCFRAGKPFGLCSPWAEHNAVHLELANPRPLSRPIPYKGALGLRKFDSALLDGQVSL